MWISVEVPPRGSTKNRLRPTSTTSDQWKIRVGRSQTVAWTPALPLIESSPPSSSCPAQDSGQRRRPLARPVAPAYHPGQATTTGQPILTPPLHPLLGPNPF